jgi:hypothetical protein
MSEPRKTPKARAAGADPDPAVTDTAGAVPPPPPPAAPPPPPPVAATPPPPVAAAPPPAPAAEASAPSAPTPGAPAPTAAPAPAGPPAGAQVAAAISGLTSSLKERLSGAELLLGGGALLVLGLSYLIFGFLFDSIRPTELAVVSSAALLLFMGLERMQVEGFGSWYKVILVLLGAVLLLGAAYSFLNVLRSGFQSFDLWDWLSLISWWFGGVVAGLGSWSAYRVKR